MDSMAFTDKHLERISELIKQIETENDIEIISAIDNGSRSMGINTEESDFDIRFIFIHNRRVKHVTGNYPESFNMFFDDGLYDFDGWSVDKAVKHLRESNPSLIEWLYSPIVFVDKYNFISKSLATIKIMHNKLSMFYHYSSMAVTNYKTFIKDKDQVMYKKYIYVIRPLMMLMHLDTDSEDLVVTKFTDLHERVRSQFSDEINSNIEEVVRLKQTMKGIEGVPFLGLNKWIEEYLVEIDKMKDKKSKKKGDTIEARSIISNYSKMCNETRKILAISEKNEGNQINRTNYLTVLFATLEFLWVWENQDRNSKDVPKNTEHLMSDITTIPAEIIEHIRFISNLKTTVKIDDNTLKHRATVYNALMPSVISFVQSMESDYDTSKLEINVRDDIYEYLINHVVTVLWMVNNPEKK